MFVPIFFCLASLLAIPTHQAGDLITTTCDKTLYKAYCKSVLGSASASDLPGLTKYALKLASSKGSDIIDKINHLATSDPDVQQCIRDCSENYQDAKSQIKQSTAAVDTKGYSDINIWVSSAMTSAQSCEDGFKDKGKTSPLAAVNTEFTQLCSIILTMSNLLANA